MGFDSGSLSHFGYAAMSVQKILGRVVEGSSAVEDQVEFVAEGFKAEEELAARAIAGACPLAKQPNY